MVIAVGNFSELDVRTTCLYLGENLRRDTRAAVAFDQQRRNANAIPARQAVNRLARGVHISIELVLPTVVGDLTAAMLGKVADNPGPRRCARRTQTITRD